ncbi:MAG TPA: MFS transporter [Actinomycetaceae bacterium]|nr:MFS transporter [Actinomycetaceae bacterium]
MFPLRTVVVGTFVPTVLFEMGVAATMPIAASAAISLGASLELAGFVLALIPVGQILADIPAGALAARIGDRSAMMLAGLLASAALVSAALATSLTVLAISMLAIGAASAVYFLARQAYLTEITAPMKRARVLSTLGGVHRIGMFIGPFLGAAIIAASGLRGAFWAAAGFALLSVVVAALSGSGSVRFRRRLPDDDAVTRRPATMGSVLRENLSVFATLGLIGMLIGAVRGARNTVLPLWAEHIGLAPEVTSVVFGIAALTDALLFYPAGWVMDRFGRLSVGVPSMLTMGAALALLPFTSTLTGITIVAILLGLGNGMSSGILMTLGADIAPENTRAQFLALWRVLTDFGTMTGPLVLSTAAALGSLAAGVWVMAGSSALSALTQIRWVPRLTPHASNRTRRDAGLIE